MVAGGERQGYTKRNRNMKLEILFWKLQLKMDSVTTYKDVILDNFYKNTRNNFSLASAM